MGSFDWQIQQRSCLNSSTTVFPEPDQLSAMTQQPLPWYGSVSCSVVAAVAL